LGDHDLANDLHPIHLYLIQFQLLNRRAFDVNTFKEAVAHRPALSPAPYPTPYLHGKIIAPPLQEAGWKDTIMPTAAKSLVS
jgi:spore coat protein A